MSDTYVVAVEGLNSLASLNDLPENVLKAARLAVNATTKRSQATAARSMQSQVAFPARYLTGKTSRLTVTKLAAGEDLEGKVTGRSRPTSLARFVHGTPRISGGNASAKGVNVEVKPGLARRMPGAFLIKLRAGKGDGDGFNLGLAIRTKNERRPGNAYKPVPLGKNVWLLYGPSVDQVFKATREQIRPDMEVFMQREFERLLEVGI